MSKPSFPPRPCHHGFRVAPCGRPGRRHEHTGPETASPARTRPAPRSVSFVLAAVLGYALLHKRVGRLGLVETGRALGRLVLAAALAAVPAWLPVVVLRHEIGDGKAASGLTLAAGGLVLIGGYAAAAYALRIRDVTEVLAMIKGRFRG